MNNYFYRQWDVYVKKPQRNLNSYEEAIIHTGEDIRLYGVDSFPESFEPKNVIFNGPATIVFWNDGTKTVVKCEGEAFDKEKGLAMAIAKRALGDKGNYYNVFKKWCVEDDDEELRNYETLTTNSLTSSFVTIAEDFNKSIEESVKRMFGSSD